MTTQNATVAPPMTTAARRYSQQIHALVDQQTREYTLGLAVLTAERGGYSRPREGEQIRELLDVAIAQAYESDPQAYAAAVRRGRQELEVRMAEAERRAAETGGMVEAVVRADA